MQKIGPPEGRTDVPPSSAGTRRRWWERTRGARARPTDFVASPEALWSSPDHPAPEGARLEAVATTDEILIRTARWDSDAEPVRGTVLLLQGRAEYIEKYYEVIRELRARGFAVVAFDWRGQGQSGPAGAGPGRGHIDHFDDFGRDLAAVASAVLSRAPKPVVTLAHSMGGCIALAQAAAGTLPADRLVAIAPMVGLSLVRRPGLVRFAARILRLTGGGRWPVPGASVRSVATLPFPGNRLTRDPARFRRMAEIATALGNGAIGPPTIGWLHAAFEAMRSLEGRGGSLRVPTLVVAAGDDPVCSTAEAVRFAQSLGPDRIVVIPHARHEILMEKEEVRTAFWAAFDAFVDAPPTSAGEMPEHLRVQPFVA